LGGGMTAPIRRTARFAGGDYLCQNKCRLTATLNLRKTFYMREAKARNLTGVGALFLGISVLLSGCGVTTHNLNRDVYAEPTLRRVFDKNYKLNEKRAANVGDAIITYRDFYVARRDLPYATPTVDFTFGDAFRTQTYSKGTRYPTKGDIFANNIKYTVVLHPKPLIGDVQGGVLVASDGTIPLTLAVGGPANGAEVKANLSWKMTLTPPDARMVRGFEELVSTEKGHVNYELLFSGVDKNRIAIKYREFSPEGLARVAFFNDLTYEATAKTIRFKDFKIEIHDASSERITYTITEEPKQ